MHSKHNRNNESVDAQKFTSQIDLKLTKASQNIKD